MDDRFAIFQKRLEEIRSDNGLSIAKMARRAGIPKGSMESYFKGHKPGFDALIAIAEGFGKSLDWLCGFDEFHKDDVELARDELQAIADGIANRIKQLDA